MKNSLGFPINAGNVAQYALAKYVNKALKVHPYYPIALSKKLGEKNETQTLGWEVIDGKLQANETLISKFMLSDVGLQPPSSENATTDQWHDLTDNPHVFENGVLNLENFIPHDKYPQGFFTGDRKEIDPTSPVQVSPTGKYAKDDENLHCTYDEAMESDKGAVIVDFAERNIDDACSKLKDQSLGPRNTGFQYPYEFEDAEKKANALWVGAFWNTGDELCKAERKVAENECKDQLRKCLNGCQVNTTTLKKGGSRINSCIVYRLGVEHKPTF
ncbi:hypothetical protein FQN49_005669 [Arthroderma sp. PD_2]|nr:hypothetical protein FQN49_005669 [Arthroderma sp. PD_2]